MSTLRPSMSKIVNMALRTFPQWRGFDLGPRGRGLAQVVDMTGPMGIAYERSIGFFKDEHVHDRLMIVCPRRGSSLTIVSPTASVTIDHEAVAIVAEGCPHSDVSASTVYDTFALYPEAALVAEGLAAVGLSRAAFARATVAPVLVRRTRWLDEAIERYFSARVLADDPAVRSPRAAFLEHEIVVEVLGALPTSKRTARTTPVDPLFERAVQTIEAHLFSPLELDWIAKRVGASVSTLLRLFRREIAMTPYAYVKVRRLEEGKRLLEEGAQVKEAALLVGYESAASFSKAFRAARGVSPNDVRARR